MVKALLILFWPLCGQL